MRNIYILTKTSPLILGSRSFPVGDEPNTYSTILTPNPPVSEDRGDKIFAASLPGKLPDLLGTIVIGCDTEWSENKKKIIKMVAPEDVQ